MATRISIAKALGFLWACSSMPLALGACYQPDGRVTTQKDFQECPRNEMCCALGRAAPPGADNGNYTIPTRDECLPNGLCENRFNVDGEEMIIWWRNWCTDQEWTNGTCLNICMDDTTADGNTPVTPCDGTRTSEKWCCGTTRACCNRQGEGVFIAPTLGRQLSVIDASTVPSSTPTTTPNASTTPPPSTTSGALTNSPNSPAANQTSTNPAARPNGNSDGGLSTGAKAGIGIGAVCGALLLAGLIFFVIRALRWKSQAKGEPYSSSSTEAAEMYQAPPQTKYAYARSVGPVTELSATTHHELPTTKEGDYHHQLP